VAKRGCGCKWQRDLCYAGGMTLTRRSLFAALGTLPLTRLAWGQAAHRLTVLHMNDFHSRHEPVDGRALACGLAGHKAGQVGCFGGSARLATAIKAQRAAAEADGRAVLLLDAGDQFQGSLFYTAHHGMAELAVMHALGTDAMAVGNHEFDNGPGTLGRFAAAARFPVLSANVDATAEPALAGRLRPYAMFDRAGLRIAVVGLTTTEALLSSSPGPNVRIGDAKAALAATAAAARAAGADMVVALSHLGVAADGGLDIPGVGVILGGHSHTLLSNVEPGALGPHPVVSPSAPWWRRRAPMAATSDGSTLMLRRTAACWPMAGSAATSGLTWPRTPPSQPLSPSTPLRCWRCGAAKWRSCRRSWASRRAGCRSAPSARWSPARCSLRPMGPTWLS